MSNHHFSKLATKLQTVALLPALALGLTHCALSPDGDSEADDVGSTSQAETVDQRYAAIVAKEAAIGSATLGTRTALNTNQSPAGGGASYANNSYRILYGDNVDRAHEVHGWISGKYGALGAYSGFLGYPTTDETSTPKGDGVYSAFEGGSIYYKWGAPAPYEVHGWIDAVWGRLGRERSAMGWPTSDETPTSVGAKSTFEAGAIYYNSGYSLENGTVPIIYNAGSYGGGQTGPTLSVSLRRVTGWGWYLTASGTKFTPGTTVNLHWRTKYGSSWTYPVRPDASGNISLSSKYLERTLCFSYNNLTTFQAIESGSTKTAVAAYPVNTTTDCTASSL